MVTILKTRKFHKWLLDLKDLKGKARIQVRLDRLELGHFGDCSTIESGLFELRIHYGPGYRVYFMKSGKQIIVLLAGGDKTTQSKDIKLAIKLSKEI
jgi:putative addiction module killer protein